MSGARYKPLTLSCARPEPDSSRIGHSSLPGSLFSNVISTNVELPHLPIEIDVLEQLQLGVMEPPKLKMDKSTLAPRVIPDDILACLRACADPNRLRIFALLLKGESCHGILNETLGLAPNLLSHHLRVLREAGLIQDRRDSVDARWIYYSVDEAALSRWYRWLLTFFDPAQLAAQREVCGPEQRQRQESALIKPLAPELTEELYFSGQNA